jgi:hypothetical protein
VKHWVWKEEIFFPPCYKTSGIEQRMMIFSYCQDFKNQWTNKGFMFRH